jgi:hypothetical protein
VDAAVQGLREWAAAVPARRAMLALRLRIVIPQGYGTSYAQAQLRRLAGELE